MIKKSDLAFLADTKTFTQPRMYDGFEKTVGCGPMA